MTATTINPLDVPEHVIDRVQAYSDSQYDEFMVMFRTLIRGGAPQAMAYESAHFKAIGLDITGRPKAEPVDLRDDVWPDPQPLPLGLPSVAPFEFHLLPQSLRPWGEDIVDRMRCPPDYIGVSIMAAVAAVVGRKIAIRPKQHDDWSVIAESVGIPDWSPRRTQVSSDGGSAQADEAPDREGNRRAQGRRGHAQDRPRSSRR